MRLRDRRVLVTGAASGIGLAIARVVTREGARVAMLERRVRRRAAPAGASHRLLHGEGRPGDVRQDAGDGSRAARIRVNAICPGIIDTPMFRGSWEDAPHPQAELAKILDRYLIKRTGQPEEIAYAALAVDGGGRFTSA